jgi:hypothetical protein
MFPHGESSLKMEIFGVVVGEATGTVAILTLAVLVVFLGLLFARGRGWI